MGQNQKRKMKLEPQQLAEWVTELEGIDQSLHKVIRHMNSVEPDILNGSAYSVDVINQAITNMLLAIKARAYDLCDPV